MYMYEFVGQEYEEKTSINQYRELKHNYSCFSDVRDSCSSHSRSIFVYMWSSDDTRPNAPHQFMTNHLQI